MNDSSAEGDKKTFWAILFIFAFLNIFLSFVIGFILAFNPGSEQTATGKYLFWFAKNIIYSQWFYIIPLAVLFYKTLGKAAMKGVLFAGVVSSLYFLLHKLF